MEDRSGSRRFDARRSRAIRWAYGISGLFYPLWYTFTPSDALDSLWVWVAVGAWLSAAAALPLLLPALRRWQDLLLASASYAVAAQMFSLATLNSIHPFYAIGSVMTVSLTAMVTQSRAALLTYSGFVCLLAAASFAITREPLALVYWVSLTLILPYAYLWLSVQLDAERLHARYRRELEDAIEQRTRALASANRQLRSEMEERRSLEEKLRLAHKMEALGRLAGGVAHDYNNILTAVLGNASLLIDQLPEGSQPRSDAEQIQDAAQRAAALTAQLLAFSRGAALETELIDPNELIAELRPILRQLLGEDVVLETELEPELPPIRINRSQIEQVLVNLVANARDAMPDGGCVRIASSRGQLDARPGLALRVSDTGTGMDEETRARIFDPFFTTKGPRSGTGLGLSIVYGIVEQAGGEIRVASQLGKGSLFEIVLPTASGVPDLARRIEPREHYGTERILVVEDEPDLRRIVCRMLRQCGYTPVDEAEPAAALERLEREPFDLLLTDVVMPGMSGVELAQRLAKSGSSIPVLFMSGHLDHPIAGSGELPHQANLLSKPFTRERLCERVRQTLRTAAQQS